MLEKVTRMVIVSLFTLALISALFIKVNPVMAVEASAAPGPGPMLPISGAEVQNAEKLELSCQYPVLSSNVGLTYSYSSNISYTGGSG